MGQVAWLAYLIFRVLAWPIMGWKASARDTCWDAVAGIGGVAWVVLGRCRQGGRAVSLGV